MLPSWLALLAARAGGHVARPAERGPLGDHDARRLDVAREPAARLDHDLLGRLAVTDHLAGDDQRVGRDVGLDAAARGDPQLGREAHAALDAALDHHRLGAVKLALQLYARPDPADGARGPAPPGAGGGGGPRDPTPRLRAWEARTLPAELRPPRGARSGMIATP